VTQHIESVHLAVPDADLKDLHERLSRVRWPAGRTVTDTSQGPTPEKLKALTDYWRDSYDWRNVESELNDWGLHRTTIDGLDIDFLHVRSPQANATPLVMTHGWPGSVLEFRKVIGPLTDPAAHGAAASQAFHLVIPVLPGFGFSAKPQEAGWTIPRIARAWITLMGRLGYQRWGAQGGDLGCAVTDEIAKRKPAGLIGTHLNFAMFPPAPTRSRTPHRKNGKRWAMRRISGTTCPATPKSSKPGRRRSATHSPTHPPARPPGSTPCSRTPAARPATPKPPSPWTRSSTTS